MIRVKFLDYRRGDALDMGSFESVQLTYRLLRSDNDMTLASLGDEGWIICNGDRAYTDVVIWSE